MRAILLVALLGGVAFGADRRAAAQHFQHGSQLYADGKWSEALAEFEAGYEAYPLRGFLVNIGQCYRKLERLEEAADAWRHYLQTHPNDARLREEVGDALAEVEAAIRARAPAPAPPVETVVPPPPEAPAQRAEVPALALTETPKPVEHKKSRAWVWAIVGVALAGAAAAAVTVGVVEYQNSTPHAGSLGLLDGRR
jgi:tetratricopeptide (TPR) repeat protein